MATAAQSQTLVNSRRVNIDCDCERALKAWKTCASANVMNAIVVATRKPSPSTPYHFIPTANANSVTAASTKPSQTIAMSRCRGSSDSFGLRGGLCITSGADGSSANANAGKMSVIKLSHKIWSATSGSGQPTMSATNTVRISEKLQENK